MADLVPATVPETAASTALAPATSLLTPFTDPAGGPVLTRLSAFAAQPAVRRMLPAFIGLSAIGGALLAWSALSPDPQRTLYTQLDDGERASVAAALDQAAIAYHIDNSTGALTVSEADFYRARMLVASDGALATPESGAQMLDSLPMGASRTLEGERLRAAREADLQMTIREIDGVESVRVHLAEGEKSVFVREAVAPSASVMIRLARGRSLTESQVGAIANLVAASVPGLSADAVRVVDQHGRLLSEGGGANSDRLDTQARMEAKLREQVSQLLGPMLGEGNFTSEIQVELNMDEVTSARESYEKEGALRSISETSSQSSSAAPAVGVPGVLANTAPLPPVAQPGAPQGTPAPAAGAAPAPTVGDTSSSRMYELGREVSVANTAPGGIKRLSVAVAISDAAIKGASPKELKEIESLVGAAVGADPQRGDTVKVVSRGFTPASEDALPFYEAPWFAMVVRNGAAVLAVLLVLLLGVRPVVKALRGDKPAAEKKAKKGKKAKGAAEEDDEEAEDSDGTDALALQGQAAPAALPQRPGIPGLDPAAPDLSRAELLTRQVSLAQKLVTEKPDSAVQALRQMLAEPENEDDMQQEAA